MKKAKRPAKAASSKVSKSSVTKRPAAPPAKKKTGPQANTRWHAQFIAEMLKFPNVSAACGICGVSWSTAHRHRAQFPEFAESWDDARRKAADLLEQAMYQRAAIGYLKPVYQGGKKVGEVREFSDSVGVVMLKGLKPEIYGDKSKVELSGKVILTEAEIESRSVKAEKGLIATIRAAELAGREKHD